MPSFEGLHDITMTDLPPRRKPYLIMAPEDRIGTPHIPIDTEKVVAIVESDYPDQTQANAPEDDTSRAIAQNLIEFLKHEVDRGRLPTNLLPLQSGIGNIANAVIGGLAHDNNFDRLKVWTEVLQDSKLLGHCFPTVSCNYRDGSLNLFCVPSLEIVKLKQSIQGNRILRNDH